MMQLFFLTTSALCVAGLSGTRAHSEAGVAVRGLHDDLKHDNNFPDPIEEFDERIHLSRQLTEDYVRENDVCRIGRKKYGKCKEKKFPKCEYEMCYNRKPMKKLFYDDDKIHPMFYIDYDSIECAPEPDWNCDRCDNPSTFCRKAGHCMTRKNYKKYCTDASNSRASKIKRKQQLERQEERRKKQERRKRRRKRRRRREEKSLMEAREKALQALLEEKEHGAEYVEGWFGEGAGLSPPGGHITDYEEQVENGQLQEIGPRVVGNEINEEEDEDEDVPIMKPNPFGY